MNFSSPLFFALLRGWARSFSNSARMSVVAASHFASFA